MEIQKARVAPSPRKKGGADTPRSQKQFLEQLLRQCPKAPVSFIEPMQCKLVGQLPTAGKWLYELKLDGFRALAIKNGNSIGLISRNKKDLTPRYPELVESIGRLGCKRVVLDGEIVALDKRGWPSFQILQNLGNGGDERNLFFYAFDVVNMEGRDTRTVGIEERKMLLGSIGLGPASLVQVVTGVEADSSALLEVVQMHALEGLVAKKAGSFYEAGQRSGTWIKYKNLQEQEFVIAGYTEPEGTRQSFGALLVGFYEDGELQFASKVGTGFTSRLLGELYKTFQPLRQKECPFVNLPETSSGRWGQGLTRAQMKTVTWLKPRLVCEIGFTEWTEGNHLRHPTFKGMREDKSAKDVVRERAA